MFSTFKLLESRIETEYFQQTDRKEGRLIWSFTSEYFQFSYLTKALIQLFLQLKRNYIINQRCWRTGEGREQRTICSTWISLRKAESQGGREEGGTPTYIDVKTYMSYLSICHPEYLIATFKVFIVYFCVSKPTRRGQGQSCYVHTDWASSLFSLSWC